MKTSEENNALESAASPEERINLSRFRWVLGAPYFVEGTMSLTEIPILYFIKFTLGMGGAGGQLFDSLRQIGWFIKPVWGYISDKVPIFGYHRKSWYVLMAFLACVFWVINALLSFIGLRVAEVYLLTFNLAFATYAFVDVVCDALMVTYGRREGKVGAFVNFQWTILAIANAGSVYLGGWFETRIQERIDHLWLVFLLTGGPPLLTAIVGILFIDETRVEIEKKKKKRASFEDFRGGVKKVFHWLRTAPASFREFRRNNRPMWFMMLFIFFWKFSPSIGFIERSYLIDVRGFTPDAFGIILSAGGVTFLVSVLVYSWVVKKIPSIGWHHYLYAMVALGVITFPLSFYLYLNPNHPWWKFIYFRIPEWLNPLPGWNRYEWFRLVVQVTLGFATIPAFMIPLTIAGETVNLAYAGMGYAFLMSLSNVTNLFEGVVGAGLYDLFSKPSMRGLLDTFQASFLNIAGTTDTRTLILEMFVYISLFFTLLTIPFIELLRRELDRRGIEVHLGGSKSA